VEEIRKVIKDLPEVKPYSYRIAAVYDGRNFEFEPSNYSLV